MADDKHRGDVRRSLDQRRDIFEKLHHRDGLSLREVAFRLGVSIASLTRWINLRGVPVRSKSDGQTARHQRARDELERDAPAVARLRLKERLTLDEIAKQCGYKYKSTPAKTLKSLGLQGPLSTLPTWEEWQAAIRNRKTEPERPAGDPLHNPTETVRNGNDLP